MGSSRVIIGCFNDTHTDHARRAFALTNVDNNNRNAHNCSARVLDSFPPPLSCACSGTCTSRGVCCNRYDDFLLDRQEVRVTASLAKYGNRSAETSCVCTQGHTCLPTYCCEYIILLHRCLAKLQKGQTRMTCE